jgi:hypothetical protein
LRMPRQRGEKRIDQAARNQEKVSESFPHESVQDEVGTHRHRMSILVIAAGRILIGPDLRNAQGVQRMNPPAMRSTRQA